MAAVEEELGRLLSTPDPPLAAAVETVISRPGKRLRPLLSVLGSLAIKGRLEPAILRGAAAVESLHLASLVHDDVIDTAPTRSGLPTPAAAWGNLPAVLLGDYFFARALRGAAAIGPGCLRRFLSVAESLVAGDFGQAAKAFTLPDAETYFGWIEAKTARLFALAAAPGNAGHPGLTGYALALGMAYQLRDDLLDLTADEAELGKPTMNDCRRGLFTYPLIAACAAEPRSASLLARPDPDDPSWRRRIAALLERTGAAAATREKCRFWAAKARESLARLAPGPVRDALACLAAWVGGGGD